MDCAPSDNVCLRNARARWTVTSFAVRTHRDGSETSMNEWTWTRWWLIGWLLVATGFGLQAINRLSGAQEFYDERTGDMNVATWNLLVGGIESGLLTVGLLFVATLPAVWQMTRNPACRSAPPQETQATTDVPYARIDARRILPPFSRSVEGALRSASG